MNTTAAPMIRPTYVDWLKTNAWASNAAWPAWLSTV
jgi:hypothetical protein